MCDFSIATIGQRRDDETTEAILLSCYTGFIGWILYLCFGVMEVLGLGKGTSGLTGGILLLLTLVLYWALAGTLSLRNVRDSRKNGIFLFLILSVLFGLHGLLYAWNDGELEAQLRLASRIVESGLMMWLGIYQLINLGTD